MIDGGIRVSQTSWRIASRSQPAPCPSATKSVCSTIVLQLCINHASARCMAALSGCVSMYRAVWCHHIAVSLSMENLPARSAAGPSCNACCRLHGIACSWECACCIGYSRQHTMLCNHGDRMTADPCCRRRRCWGQQHCDEGACRLAAAANSSEHTCCYHHSSCCCCYHWYGRWLFP